MPYAPTLTVDTAAAPRCLVMFAALAAGAVRVNVQAVVEGRTFKVRGGVDLFAAGGAVVMDYEVPLGVPVSYRAEMFDAAGASLGWTDATQVTVDAGFTRPGMVWVSQPLYPAGAVRVDLLVDAAASISRPPVGDVEWAEGARVGMHVGTGRRGVDGVPLPFLVSVADADRVQGMLGGYATDYPAVLLFRTGPGVRLPALLFGSVHTLEEIPRASAGVVEFRCAVTEVQPPFPGLVAPSLRRADIDKAYGTRNARAAAYATRLARDADYSKAGLAGPL